jgi:hypothetical protein
MEIKVKEIRIAVVGLWFTGCSSSAFLLIADHPVIDVAPRPIDLETAITLVWTNIFVIPSNRDLFEPDGLLPKESSGHERFRSVERHSIGD